MSIGIKNKFCTSMGVSLFHAKYTPKTTWPERKRTNAHFVSGMLSDASVPAVRKKLVPIHLMI